MSRLSRYRSLARKAITRPPSHVVRGVGRELRRQLARPWVRVRPAMLSDRTVLEAAGCSQPSELPGALAAAPFFPLSGESMATVAAAFRLSRPDSAAAIVTAADRVLAHEFDLLGSGPRALGATIPWRADFKCGEVWPRAYAFDLDFEQRSPESDVKVPWELSRFQHGALLGQAFLFTGREAYRTEFKAQFEDWERDNPWGYSVNWICAMDVAIRAHNLQWAYRCLFGDGSASPEFALRFARALYLHGEFIARHLEVSDINGNHYLADAVGLVSAGAWLCHSPAGAGWLELGRRMLEEEMQRQVHPDGVDFEQSTAYHRFVTEMFLTGFGLLRRADRDVPESAWQRLARMIGYVAAYTKPDGRAPLIGDADDGRMQKLAPRDIGDHRYLLSIGACLFGRPDLARAAGRFWDETWWLLGAEAKPAFDAMPAAAQEIASAAFPDGGMYVLRAPGAHAIVDCAEVGMQGRGGHGHNDILSFELSLARAPVVSDCGSFVYTADPVERDLFRSTAFHNGVQVDDEEVNRFLSPPDMWRLRNDARPVDVQFRSDGPGGFVAASHTGYDRLPSPVRHRRSCALTPDGQIFAIADDVQSAGSHRYTWRFHLAPGARVRRAGTAIAIETAGEQILLLCMSPDQPAAVFEEGFVSPSYGVRTPVVVIRADLVAAGPLSVSWGFGVGLPAEIIMARARQCLENR